MEFDTIVCGDCLDVMAAMPDGCVDLVVADPPYDLGVWDWVEGWVEELPRIMGSNASLYVFCGIGERSDSLSRLLPLIKRHFTFKNLITWRKQRGYGTQRNWMYVREEIIFAVSGSKYVFHPQYTGEVRRDYGFRTVSGKLADDYNRSVYKRASNVWVDIHEITGGIGNKTEFLGTCPAQKPVASIERLILASSDAGDLVFDPFMGSGTTAVAASRLGRHFYGCDISREYVEAANERVARERMQLRLDFG